MSHSDANTTKVTKSTTQALDTSIITLAMRPPCPSLKRADLLRGSARHWQTRQRTSSAAAHSVRYRAAGAHASVSYWSYRRRSFSFAPLMRPLVALAAACGGLFYCFANLEGLALFECPGLEEFL